VEVTYYDAAGYCNWLSARAGLPESEWCYEPNRDGKYAEGMTIKAKHLQLTGYRLPTDAEWEYACRAGAVTARPFGRPDGLLAAYAWGQQAGPGRAGPSGRLKPNDLGLFDVLGNASEWVYDTSRWRPQNADGEYEDGSDRNQDILVNRRLRSYRGGSVFTPPSSLRCAGGSLVEPHQFEMGTGLRLARTIRP
jgi:formylglycine-generating enzyme required for sulfatase activity